MLRTSPRKVATLLALVLTMPASPARGANDPPTFQVAPTPPRTPAEQQKLFHLPPGFSIELVAAEPQIRKPMNLAFDARGRLWVTDSVEYPFPAPADRKPRDTVKILSDLDGHGLARRITTFADGLNIPIGVLPHGKGALVFSIPNIYRLRDTDGDDRADRREVLYGTIDQRDTHGLTNAFSWGFDGWVYACHGFANQSTLKAADGSSLRLHSGNTYRMRPDGSRLEQFTHGQVNPFGLSFDPLGNLFSADCHTKPVMMLLRGGWYESFGKPHDGLGFAPQICGHDHGSTGIAGIVCYAADHYPPAYRDTVFVGNVMTNRINHDRLHRNGSTLTAIQQPDFLTCDDPWFRPVDLKLGPDGAIYVADFYNRIIGHYEVPLTHPGRDRERGRIWRIVYRGEDGKGRPVTPRADWTTATVPELVAGLADPNLVVRTTATNQLVERGDTAGLQAVRSVMHSRSNPFQRMHGLWVLQRSGILDEATLSAAADDVDSGVRVHAMRVLAERPVWTVSERLLALAGLRDNDPSVQRAAAEAVGLHGSPDQIRPLLELRRVAPAEDTQLVHTVRMALREQLRLTVSWSGLPTAGWTDADARAIADVALGVPSPEAATYLLAHLERLPEPPGQVQRFLHHISRYAPELETRQLAFLHRHRPDDARQQASWLKSMHQGAQEGGRKLTEAARRHGEGLTENLLSSKSADLLQAGIDLASSLRVEAAQPRLAALAGMRDLPDSARLGVATALAQVDARRHVALLGKLLADSTEPIRLRSHTATVLAGTNLPEARAELVKVLESAPAALQNTIAAELARSLRGGEQLLETVATGKASARLLQEMPVALRLQAAGVPEWKERVAKLTQGMKPADQQLQELLRRRRTSFAAARPDVPLGAKVYEKHCAICHQLGGKGAKLGPQLDGIGIRGVDRLLEDLLDPNRNVDQAFRATTIVHGNGQIAIGLVLREEGEVLILADSQGKEVRIPKSAIEERTVSQMSPMPANQADQISEADFQHLLAYLLSQRSPSGGGAK